MLTDLFQMWAVASIALGALSLGRAPAVTVGLFGSIAGALVGFLVGNADGPAEVPAYTAVGASGGLIVGGLTGLFVAEGRRPSWYLRRAAVGILIATPFAAGALTFLLQIACPLYISGRKAGFCDYQGGDLMGGWVSGVVVAFVFDALFIVGLLFASARQADTPALSGSLSGSGIRDDDDGSPSPRPHRA